MCPTLWSASGWARMHPSLILSPPPRPPPRPPPLHRAVQREAAHREAAHRQARRVQQKSAASAGRHARHRGTEEMFLRMTGLGSAENLTKRRFLSRMPLQS